MRRRKKPHGTPCHQAFQSAGQALDFPSAQVPIVIAVHRFQHVATAEKRLGQLNEVIPGRVSRQRLASQFFQVPDTDLPAPTPRQFIEMAEHLRGDLFVTLVPEIVRVIEGVAQILLAEPIVCRTRSVVTVQGLHQVGAVQKLLGQANIVIHDGVVTRLPVGHSLDIAGAHVLRMGGPGERLEIIQQCLRQLLMALHRVIRLRLRPADGRVRPRRRAVAGRARGRAAPAKPMAYPLFELFQEAWTVHHIRHRQRVVVVRRVVVIATPIDRRLVITEYRAGRVFSRVVIHIRPVFPLERRRGRYPAIGLRGEGRRIKGGRWQYG